MGSLFGRDKKKIPVNLSTTLTEVESHLPHEPQQAYAALRSVLAYPARLDDRASFQAAMSSLSKVAEALGAEEIVVLAKASSNEPEDRESLYGLGYCCHEHGIYEVGAAVLHRAHKLYPGDVELVCELSSCLEELGEHRDAVEFIAAQKYEEPVCHYLLGFNSLMMGDLETASKSIAGVRSSDIPDHQFMAEALESMVTRAQALGACSDLRGWHLALNASLLLHLSPYGFDEGMNGRYSFVQDSYSTCREGLELLKQSLAELKIPVPRVYSLQDRSSQILAKAAAEFFGVELLSWPGEQEGLIVAYDLEDVSSEDLESLYEERPGRILWAHASNWVRPFPWAPDITTFLYQVNSAPWAAGRLVIDPETETTSQSEVDDSPVEELVKKILDEDSSISSHDGVESLLNFCKVKLPQSVAPSWMGGQQQRVHQRKGSPISSSQFC